MESIEPNNPDEGSHSTSAAATGRSTQKRPNVLRHVHFRNVWLGSFGSSIGAWMEFVGISWIINTSTDRPAVYLGWHGMAQLTPMMLFGVAGGVVADRVNRKKLLLFTQAIMMLIALALTVLAISAANNKTTIPVSMLMGLSALMGTTMAFNVPAWQVLTPRLVPREELTDAIVLNGLQFNIARAIGPALGGLLLAVQGPAWLFAINTLSFLGVLFAVTTTPDSPAPARNEHDSIWKETRDGLRFTLREVGPRAAFWAMTVFGFLASPLQRLLAVYVSDVYFTRTWSKSHQEFAYGILLAFMGLGAVIGVFIMRSLPRWYPKHHLIPLSILGCGIAIAGFGSSASPYLGIPFLIMAGAGWLMSFNATFSAMQLLVTDAMRGRVMAVCNTAVFGVMAIGPLLTGYLGEATGRSFGESIGNRIGLTVAGAVMCCAGLVMLIFRTPEVDGIKQGDVGYDRHPSLWRGITGEIHRPQRD
jgi:MFS family permease